MEENIKFVKAAVPEAFIPNSYASGTAVAWVMYQKFANAMPPIVLYHYTETRARYNAVDFLDCFSDGYLETDGYQGYNNLPGIRRCSCWAHTRRYFIDAVSKTKM